MVSSPYRTGLTETIEKVRKRATFKMLQSIYDTAVAPDLPIY